MKKTQLKMYRFTTEEVLKDGFVYVIQNLDRFKQLKSINGKKILKFNFLHGLLISWQTGKKDKKKNWNKLELNRVGNSSFLLTSLQKAK